MSEPITATSARCRFSASLKKRPALRPGIEDFLSGRKRAVVIDARNFLALITRGDGAVLRTVLNEAGIEACGDGANGRTELLDGFGIFKAESLAVALFG